MPSFRLGSTRRRSTSRLASTLPASLTWATCSRCAPRVPSLESGPPRARRLRRHRPARSPASRPTPRPASHALLSTRQYASAFNQPLSFDTSKVTDMEDMFEVCSARALPRPTPSRFPAHTSPHTVCPAFDSAVHACIQPAAELRHVQGHGHAGHVRGMLRACPAPPGAFSRALTVHVPLAPTLPHTLPPPGPHLAPHRMPSFRLGRAR